MVMHGLSMEQEVRNILQNTLAAETSPSNGLEFAMRINQRFKGLGADEIALLMLDRSSAQVVEAGPHRHQRAF